MCKLFLFPEESVRPKLYHPVHPFICVFSSLVLVLAAFTTLLTLSVASPGLEEEEKLLFCMFYWPSSTARTILVLAPSCLLPYFRRKIKRRGRMYPGSFKRGPIFRGSQKGSPEISVETN